jgi:D-hydroxyproline dehydrogenase subunit beta
MYNTKEYDIAIIGGGIVGLAMALANAKKGKKVAVFERNPQAVGASVRNFGMLWPIGQPPGKLLDRALHSREIWLDVAKQANLWHRKCGSLHLAYHDDEMTVLEEFYRNTANAGYKHQLILDDDVHTYSDIVKPKNLKGALWSETEVNIAPRQAIQKLPTLLSEQYGVDFYFEKFITDICFPYLYTFDDEYKVNEHIYVCSGADFETLYPSVYTTINITKCKLQMLSTAEQPNKFDMGPMLCAGLTLRHYPAFADCQTLQAVSDRYDREEPLFKKYGIHVLLSQNNNNQLIIGDSHEYGLNVSPFDNEDINRLIMNYLHTFATYPKTFIAERWYGIYPKMKDKTEYVEEIEPNVTIVNGLGGAGMTLSFGLAEEIVNGRYINDDTEGYHIKNVEMVKPN